MFRSSLVPRVMIYPMSDGSRDARSPWRMVENMNRNVERMMEDVCNDWSAGSETGQLASLFGKDTSICHDASKFEMKLDVQNYKPDEISVKLDGRNLEISAKHEEMQDEHGFIARQFSRRVLLPENVDPDSLESSLSTDGCLSLKAKVKAIEGGDAPRQITIQRQQSAPKGEAKK